MRRFEIIIFPEVIIVQRSKNKADWVTAIDEIKTVKI